MRLIILDWPWRYGLLSKPGNLKANIWVGIQCGIIRNCWKQFFHCSTNWTVSFNSNAEMEELWEEAVSLNPAKNDDAGSSELPGTNSGRVILASISTSIDDGRFVVWWSQQLGEEVEPDVCFEAPKLDVCVNVCSWTTTFHNLLEASQYNSTIQLQ
ncbi:hypothetical protein BSKO_11671 [Bryopsis sp. KO-2023]|nr:hypothetical protein BSKO_11671 [Bryopsis sp. KO-2023]